MSESSLPPRRTYTELLQAKKLGYPLYYPEPCTNALRSGWSGVSIGDVGIINYLGGFDFKFNVIKKPNIPNPSSYGIGMPGAYHDVGETVSLANGLPLHAELSILNGLPQFPHIVLEEKDIGYYDNDCHPGQVIGRNITHALSVKGNILPQIPPIRAGLTFNIKCGHEQAASLILPDGAARMEVHNEQLGQFYNLARQHGASWLRLFPFTGTSLCLVTGCVKTSSWGLMSLYSYSNTGDISLKFGVAPVVGLLPWTWLRAGPLSWTWLDAGPADTRHSKDTDNPNRNQCVFLRGIMISKKDPKWSPLRRNVGELVHLGVLGTGESLHFNTGSGNFASGSTTRAPTSGGTPSNNSGGQHGAGQSAFRDLSQNVDGGNTDLQSNTPDIGTEDQNLDDDVVIEPLTEVPVSNHPSETINQRLLHENPSAEFAMTHDDQWAEVLSEIDTPLDEETLWLRMLEKYNVIVESNCVFFVEKKTVKGKNPESPDLISQFDKQQISNLDYHPEGVHEFVNPTDVQTETSKRKFAKRKFGRSPLWPCGSKNKPFVLTYSFLGREHNMIQRNRESKVSAVIRQIEERVPGVKFYLVDSSNLNAVIRIGFDHEHPDGKFWSHVGSDATRIESDKPTMNLSGVTGHESGYIEEDSKEYGDIVHQFFHALGMPQEFKLNFSISGTTPKKDLGPGWSVKAIYDNIVRKLIPDGIEPYPPTDNGYYHICEWTNDGSEVKCHNKPSNLDWGWLNLMYPPGNPVLFEQALSESLNSRISKKHRASILKLYLENEWEEIDSEITRVSNKKSITFSSLIHRQ